MEQMTRGLRTYIVTSSQFFDVYKKHPFVELCKVTLSVLALRADIERTSSSASTGANFPKRHPFAAWLSSFLTAYAGSILACLLMAESPLKPFCNPNSLLYVSVAWYCVFYSPMDVCYRFMRMFPFNHVLMVCAEIYRCGNIQTGVKYAMKSTVAKEVKLKPVLMIIVGCVKGCGGSLARGMIRLVRSGTLKQSRRAGALAATASDSVDNEFQTPSFFSKASFIAAAVYSAYWLSLLPPTLDYAMVHVAIHFFFISQRLLMSMAPDPKAADPFATIEHLFCLIFFGKETSASSNAATAAGSGDADGFEGDDRDEAAAGEDGSESGGTRRRAKKDD